MKKWFARHSRRLYSARAARKLAQPLRAYRYTRWHWRWLFRALDAVWCRPVDVWRRVHGAQGNGEPRSILVVQLDHLGDAVLTTAVFPLLKARFPQARIDVLASRWNREVFANNPHIGSIHVSERNWFSRMRGARRFLEEALRLGLAMREHEYDLGIDVRGDFLAALLLWTARIPRRLGWGAGGGSFLLTDCPPWVPDRPEIESRVALLEPLGIRMQQRVRPQVYPGRAERESITCRIATSGWETGDWHSGETAPLVVVHVSAGTEAKRWPAAHLRELVTQLAGRYRAKVVLVGEDADRSLGWQVAAGLDRGRVVDWTGRLRVLELAALLERADLFVGADSGPAHLAGWAGVPSVVLFSGSNRVQQWRPPGEHVHVLHHPVSCSPCHRKQCAFADHPCMTQIIPAEVCELAGRILAAGAERTLPVRPASPHGRVRRARRHTLSEVGHVS